MTSIDAFAVEVPRGAGTSLIRVFRANKLAAAGLVLLVAVLAIAAAAPWVASYDPAAQNSD